jgi:pimeloyl-ACP methyl ester carboxylesterase
MRFRILLAGIILLSISCFSDHGFLRNPHTASGTGLVKSRVPTVWLLLLSIGCLALFITGCSTSGVTIDTDKSRTRSKAYANAIAPFAAMSALAYAPDAKDPNTTEARLKLETFLTTGPAPWQKLTNFFAGPAAMEVGLAYEVWINPHLTPKVVVIAVRGTEFTQWQDWKSNLWWLTRFFTDKNQYRIAPSAEEVGLVFEYFKNQPDTVFITTGHSLGGGVAQCLMYAYPHVSQCYAFNPSPITAYYDQLEDKRRTYSEKLPLPGFPSHRTLRIYEKGEILAYLRAQMRMFYALDDKIMEVRWDFDPKHDIIGNHGILGLARNAVSVHQDAEIPSPAPEYQPWWFRTPSSTTESPDLKKVR